MILFISLIVIGGLILFILLMKIRIKIVRTNDTQIDIFITRIFDLRIDVDELIKERFRPENVKTTLADVINIFKLVTENRTILHDFMKRAKIVKVTVIPKYNSGDPVFNTYLIFFNWQIVSLIRAYLEANFLEQLDEYYQVIIEPEGKAKGFSLEIQAETRVISIVRVILRHFRPLMQIYKNRKRSRNERASNK